MTGSYAERLYMTCGCTKVGEVPAYALFPDGRPGPASIFFKELR